MLASHWTVFSHSFPSLSAKRGNDGSSFSEDQLCAFLLDLHFAGTDTTANTLLTAFLYLMKYPHIQGMSTYHVPQPQSVYRSVHQTKLSLEWMKCHADIFDSNKDGEQKLTSYLPIFCMSTVILHVSVLTVALRSKCNATFSSLHGCGHPCITYTAGLVTPYTISNFLQQ